MPEKTPLKVVNHHLNYQKVTLKETSTSSYIHIAAEIDRKSLPFYLINSAKKKQLITQCKTWCSTLEKVDGVIEVNLFQAGLIPPGRGKYIKENSDRIHRARFDFVILIETVSDEVSSILKQHNIYQEMVAEINRVAHRTSILSARNIRRIDQVNHKKQGVFLFNYFSANDTQQNLAVWEYTAGWFEKETRLDNSTLLLPSEKEHTDFSIINHCRWDKYMDILPSLIFKGSFRKYVLDNFYANNVGAQPILYRIILE